MAKVKPKPKLVSVVWSIHDSATPINTTLREILKLMVAQHANKHVSVYRIYTNFQPLGGLDCRPRSNEKVTILYYNSRIPTMSVLPLGDEYIEIIFALNDKPAT